MMETIDILAGYEEELELLQAQSATVSERPMWPNCPSDCTVPDCSEQIFNTYSSFQRHWDNKHIKDITLYKCPNCKKSSARKDYIARHQEKFHNVKSNITGTLVPNNKYVDPKGALPYKFNHRQRMSEKRKRIRDMSEGQQLVRRGQVCRDQEAVEINGQYTVELKKSKN